MNLIPSFFGISKCLTHWACLATGWLCLVATSAHAGSVSTTQCHDTFLNNFYPNNNNGGSHTFFTGESGESGIMRALIRCDLPPAIIGRVNVTQATLTLTTAGLGSTGTTNPTAATETLYAVTEPWGEGTGFGGTTMTYTVGQACTADGATWNQRECSIAAWTTAGGTVGSMSASALSPASIGTAVAFTGSFGSGMAADVQNWANAPANNYGWRMSSSTEGGASGMAQRFYSKENGAGQPSLAINYGCKAGFQDTGNGCTTCTTTAQSACVTSQSGNTCNDPGPPSSGYTCTCNNPAYTGTGTGSCTDLNECIPNHCAAEGDAGAICLDHAAPATGYSCSCDAGFVFDGTTCSADLNACIPNHCTDSGDIGALCIDHPAPFPGYDCSCDLGFVFNGTTCSDLIFADGFDD